MRLTQEVAAVCQLIVRPYLGGCVEAGVCDVFKLAVCDLGYLLLTRQ